jgi:uncharacterized membrane protein
MDIDGNMKIGKYFLALLIIAGMLLPWSQNVEAGEESQLADQPVVRVIMFWLSTCGHCEYVINEVLPPLKDQYGEQLEILLVELVAQEDVDRLFETASILGIPANNVGVPFMLVGEEVLSGSDEIPARLPGLIETHLASGGLDYPRYAPLESYLPDTQEAQPARISASHDTQSNPPASEANSALSQAEEVKEQVSNGFTIALVVLVGMVLALIYVFYAMLKDREPGTSRRAAWLDWLVPIVALAGIGVAAYLTYVETTAADAICGPVGDCNAVQNSSYSRIFGILPVGILGLIGYVAIIIAWVIQKVRQDVLASYAQLAMLAMAFFGTLYSIYLTYLELWVINAVCMWCVSSAVIITLLMLLSIQPAVRALDSLGEE